MIGSQIYNKKNNKEVDIIYGCVTTGDEWKFLKLENEFLTVDQNLYFFTQLETILGIFQKIIEHYKVLNLE